MPNMLKDAMPYDAMPFDVRNEVASSIVYQQCLLLGVGGAGAWQWAGGDADCVDQWWPQRHCTAGCISTGALLPQGTNLVASA